MGYTYKQQYGIVVICRSEQEQRELYEKLSGMSLTLKVVVV